jgi:D-serine deaminase-like pyridoxal phosphate-dependent protein
VWYPSRIAQNIDTLVTMLPEVSRLRPHVKTHKCQEVTELMLAKGITKFKCATIAEAEMLAICQAPDVLLAYQPVATKLQRFITLIQTYTTTQFSCLVDDLSVAQAIATAIQHEITINVYIDLNVGMNRTGILPQKAEELINALLDLKGIAVKGLHAYDGHIRDQDLALRTENCHQTFVPVFALASGFSEKE